MIIRPLKTDDTQLFYEYLTGFSDASLKFFKPYEISMQSAVNVTSADAVSDENTKHYGVFVTEDNVEKLVGYYFFRYFTEEIPIYAIGIVDAYQDRGIGRQMVLHGLEEAKKAGKPGVRLTTFKDNFRAQHLYRSCGYVDTGDKNAPEGEIELFHMFDGNPVPVFWENGHPTY